MTIGVCAVSRDKRICQQASSICGSDSAVSILKRNLRCETVRGNSFVLQWKRWLFERCPVGPISLSSHGVVLTEQFVLPL